MPNCPTSAATYPGVTMMARILFLADPDFRFFCAAMAALNDPWRLSAPNPSVLSIGCLSTTHLD